MTKEITLKELKEVIDIVGIRDVCKKYYYIFKERINTIGLIIPEKSVVQLKEDVYDDYIAARDEFLKIESKLDDLSDVDKGKDLLEKFKSLYDSFAQWCSDNVNNECELALINGKTRKTLMERKSRILKVVLPILLAIAVVSAAFGIVGSVNSIFLENDSLRWCELVAEIMGIADAVLGIAFFTYEIYDDNKHKEVATVEKGDKDAKKVDKSIKVYIDIDQSNNHGGNDGCGCCNFQSIK